MSLMCTGFPGVGHIKFWKMASTFTGLKLKSEFGKFGDVKVSTVSTLAELPTGNVGWSAVT